MANTTLVWLRRTLRLADNPALVAACRRGGAVVPVYIDSPGDEGDWPAGAASRWWLHYSLKSLGESFKKVGARLVIRSGPCAEGLCELIDETGADAVYWDRCYEPAAIKRDKAIKKNLRDDGLEAKSFNTNLLFEPWEVETKTGGPYKVFTPFWRTCMERPGPGRPCDVPDAVPAPKKWPASVKLNDLGLLPKIDWAGGLRDAWIPGESGAQEALKTFLDETVQTYGDDRDRPDMRGTSRLSPYLHFGEISPRQIWHDTQHRIRSGMSADESKSANHFLREIGWREFGYHLIYHFPKTADEPLRPEFMGFPWDSNPRALKAWKRGRTGYPIVDAGMRQLWHTGWMHNRVRMIVASFLVKDLLISWKEGAAWFWDTLVDADLANNTLGWQWAGGCGADAAPYFRVFNPVLQGKKFDPEGDYVRKWVPELRGLDKKCIHEPWNAKADALGSAGVELGEDYPEPIVDHSQARDRALEAFEKIKKSK